MIIEMHWILVSFTMRGGKSKEIICHYEGMYSSHLMDQYTALI